MTSDIKGQTEKMVYVFICLKNPNQYSTFLNPFIVNGSIIKQ